MYKVWSTYPPAIAQFPNKRYIVGGTVTKVTKNGRNITLPAILTADISLEQVEWVRPAAPSPVQREVKKVTGSAGKIYTLERQSTGKWTCSCPGYQYRRFCKHTGG